MDLLQAGDPSRIGSFKLLGRLGEGGMGRVFLGASPGGRKVAIKVMHPHYANDPDFRRRFTREVAAARQVGGFHTALVVDADPDANPPWMATAFIPGSSLADAIIRRGPLDDAEVHELGAALAEGLAAIHGCGLIHRDLKPSNIILADDGPRIIDFGIAKDERASTLTAPRAVLGTFHYMSPEQLNARELTPQSDVFALGTLLAYAATCHHPFDGPVIPAVINHILNDPPDLGLLSGELRDIISDCLAKEPGNRPSTADLLPRFASPVHSQANARGPEILVGEGLAPSSPNKADLNASHQLPAPSAEQTEDVARIVRKLPDGPNLRRMAVFFAGFVVLAAGLTAGIILLAVSTSFGPTFSFDSAPPWSPVVGRSSTLIWPRFGWVLGVRGCRFR